MNKEHIRYTARLFSAAFTVILLVAGKPSYATSLEPEDGSQRQYYIGMRSGTGAPDTITDKLAIENIARYGLRTQNNHALTLNIEPRFLRITSGVSDVLYESNRSKERELTSASTMETDFGLEVTSDGNATPNTENSAFWKTINSRQDAFTSEQVGQALSIPGLITSLPLEVGATAALNGLPSLPEMTLTVTEITDEWITADISASEHAQPVVLPVGSDEIEVTANLVESHGRIRVNRDTGWLESLALFIEQAVHHGKRTVPRHLLLYVKALPDDTATGENFLDLLRFSSSGLPTSLKDDPTTYEFEYTLPQVETKAPLNNTQPTDDIETLFPDRDQAIYRIDEGDNVLILRVPFNIEDHQTPGYASLSELTLTDAQGEKIEFPLLTTDVLQGVRNTDGVTIEIRLKPLGWNEVDWGAIHGVSATLAYRTYTVEEQLFIELADTPQEITRGEATAKTIPLESEPNQWRLVLENQQDQLMIDRSAGYKDINAFSTSRLYDSPLSLTEKSLLYGITDPLSWVMQLRLEGDPQRFPLIHVKYADVPEYVDVTFEPGLSARRLMD